MVLFSALVSDDRLQRATYPNLVTLGSGLGEVEEQVRARHLGTYFPA